MERVRMVFEQLQQKDFLSRHLENLHQELDPFGTSSISWNTNDNRSQLLTAGNNEGEKILDTSEKAFHQSSPKTEHKSEPEPVSESVLLSELEPEPVNDPEPLPESEVSDPEAVQEIYGRRKSSDVSEMPERTVIVEAKIEPANIERVRMFFELPQQHFLSKHLENLLLELDPFGVSSIGWNTAINISQIKTAGINQSEKKPDAALPVSSVLVHKPDPKPVDESEPFSESESVIDLERVPHAEQEINGRRKSSDGSEMPKYTAIVETERDINIPTTSVQLFSSHSGHTIKEIEMEFNELLTNRLKHVRFVTCRHIEDINSEEILVVLCIITSRVETDATYAIKDINAPTKTLLLLIHEKKSHALPRLRSFYVLTDQKFRNLGGVFDLAFLSGSGLYKCEMNDLSLDGICTFINKNRMKTN